MEEAVGKEEEEEKQTTEHLLLLLPTPFISSPLRSASGKTGGRRGNRASFLVSRFLHQLLLPFTTFSFQVQRTVVFFAFSEVQVSFSPSLVSLATIFRSFLPTNQT